MSVVLIYRRNPFKQIQAKNRSHDLYRFALLRGRCIKLAKLAKQTSSRQDRKRQIWFHQNQAHRCLFNTFFSSPTSEDYNTREESFGGFSPFNFFQLTLWLRTQPRVLPWLPFWSCSVGGKLLSAGQSFHLKSPGDERTSWVWVIIMVCKESTRASVICCLICFVLCQPTVERQRYNCCLAVCQDVQVFIEKFKYSWQSDMHWSFVGKTSSVTINNARTQPSLHHVLHV